MSLVVRVVGLGGSGKSSLIRYLKEGRVNEDPGEPVPQTVQFNGSTFQLSELELGQQNSIGAGGIIFCLDGSDLTQLALSKELFNQLLEQAQQTNPIAIVQTKCDIQTIDAQELSTFLGADNIEDRQVMINAVSTRSGEGIEQLLEWLQSTLSQSHQRKVESLDFEAQPRVVQSRSKYKINDQQTQSKSQQTINNLMKDKRIRLLDPIQQEQEYVRLEKERIKIENMHNQLTNFKKNKKKMTPYEIKPSANPRIEVNLEFFLTDSANTIEKTNSTVDTQTDAFNDPPPSPKYVPKKTGIDAATQIEDYELFDFDREVTPILDVIVTKTLEQACLEIEQEEELLSMKKFKEAFVKKRATASDKEKQVIQKEMIQISSKNQVLKKYSEKEERKLQLLRKAQAYEISHRYLRDLGINTFTQVIKQGFYPNQFQNQLHTTFLDWLVSKTEQETMKLQDVREKMIGTFDQDVLEPIKKERMIPDSITLKKKNRKLRKSINQSEDRRIIRIMYIDEHPIASIIAQKLPKFLDGTLEEWEKNYEARMAELDSKLEQEQITEEEYTLTKKTEFPELPLNYLGLSVQNINKISFAMAHNQYYETNDKQRKLQPFALVIDKNGKWIIIDQQNQRDGKTIKYNSNIRQRYQKESDDIAISVQTESLNPEVCCILFGLRLPNLQQNSQQQSIQDFLQYSRFGIQDYHYNIPFDHTQVCKSFKFEELVRVQDNPDLADQPQTAIVLCYSLTRRFKQLGKWFLESIKMGTKGFLQDDISSFYSRTAQFVSEQYEHTLSVEKDLIEKLIEKEQEGMVQNPQEQAISKEKRRAPSKPTNAQLNQTGGSNNASLLEPSKQLDEPIEVAKTLFYNRITSPIQIHLNHNFESVEQQIVQDLTKNEAALIQSCTHGFELHVKAKTFQRVKQLKNVVKSIGEITILRKPEPIPEKLEIQQDNLDIQDDLQDSADQ